MASCYSVTPAASISGDSQFTPLFDELQRRAAVFVHPNPSPDPSAHSLGLPDTLIDFTVDTTRAIAQDRWPVRLSPLNCGASPSGGSGLIPSGW